MKYVRWLSLLNFLAAGLAAPLQGAPQTGTTLDWPCFRGPAGDGSAPGAEPPIFWSETSNVCWKVPLTGHGRSSPILLGDRLWLSTALEEGVVRKQIGNDDMKVAEHVSLRMICVDRRDGHSLWETTLFDVPHPQPVHWLNSWATPTPVAEPGRVYCDFGTFGTAALEAATGKVLWKKQLPLDHGVGPGSSPVLWRDRLLLVRDGRDAQCVTALDKQTGETIWKTDRPPLGDVPGDVKKSFCTPLVIEPGARGETQAPALPVMFVPGAQWAVAYDPLSGRELWRLHFGGGWSIGTTPVFGQGLAYFTTGFDKPELWAVRMEGAGDTLGTNLVWKSKRQVPYVASPLLSGQAIYWVSDAGIVTCADARTGEIQWQERLGGSCWASPILAQGRIYFFRQDGVCIVVKAGQQFERLAENRLDGTVTASPALDRHAFYVRTDTHLYCIRPSAEPATPPRF